MSHSKEIMYFEGCIQLPDICIHCNEHLILHDKRTKACPDNVEQCDKVTDKGEEDGNN